MINEVSVKKSGINFVINPVIELLSVLQVISGDIDGNFKPYYYVDNNKYIDTIKEYFKNYKGHEAIIKFKDYKIFNSQIMNYSFENNKLILLDENNEKLKEYNSYLNSFIKDSNFIEFYNNMNDYYKEVLNYNTNNLKELHLSENLSKYYNSKIDIKMILKIIQSDWGEYLGNKNGEYTILGGTSEINDYPVIVNERGIVALAIHECTHPFVNKNLTSDYDLLIKTEHIYEQVDNESLARKNYQIYNTYLEDLIVRAITAVIQYKFGYKTKEEFEYELKVQESYGFIYIKEIASIFLNNSFESGIDLTKEFLINKVNQYNTQSIHK